MTKEDGVNGGAKIAGESAEAEGSWGRTGVVRVQRAEWAKYRILSTGYGDGTTLGAPM